MTASSLSASHRLISLHDRDAWESTLDGMPHAFAHTWTNCRAMTGPQGNVTHLYSYESAEGRIVCPVSERAIGAHLDSVTPYGFSGFVGTGDCPGFASRWEEFAAGRGWVCGYLILNPVLPNGTWFGDAAEFHKTLYVVDLRLDEAELFARLSSSRRRQLRRADTDALVFDRADLAEFFVATYPDFIARHDAAGVYELTEESMRLLCGSDDVLLVGAARDGRLRAVSLFGFTQHAGDFLFNASLPGEEGYSAMLIWTAVLELKARGVPSLNLGGGLTEGDSLAEFKRRFGARTVPLHNLKQIYRPDLYARLCAEARVDPESTAYFPAYRAE